MYKLSIVIGTDVLLFTSNTPYVNIQIKRKILSELVIDTFCRRGLTILNLFAEGLRLNMFAGDIG